MTNAAQVTGRVVNVTDFDPAPERGDPHAQGATRTVTLDRRLEDPDGVLLPGALLCDGMVYLAYGHTLGNPSRSTRPRDGPGCEHDADRAADGARARTSGPAVRAPHRGLSCHR